jgi:hypothetical protein
VASGREGAIVRILRAWKIVIGDMGMRRAVELAVSPATMAA